MDDHYAVWVPARRFTDAEFRKLLKTIAYHATSLQKVLKTDSLPVVALRDRLWFPWFTPQGISYENDIYRGIIRELCMMAKNPTYRPSRHQKGKPSEVGLQYLLEDLKLAMKLQKYQRRFPHLYRLGQLLDPLLP